MPSDLIISRISLPPSVSAPCTTRVEVDITNIGSDVAELPFDVVLEIVIPESKFQPRPLVQWIRGAEGTRLFPNQTVTAVFQVRFPCRTQVELRATADFSLSVINNLRSDPQRTIIVAPIDLVPWLQSSLQVGTNTPIGNVFVANFDTPVLCPNGDLSVVATIRNRGCADAPAFDAELVITHSQGTKTYGSIVSGLPAGSSVQLSFFISGPFGLGPISFQFCADINHVVSKQCSTAELCTTVTRVVQTGSLPIVTFNINGPVVPGQMPTITWSLQNDCADLGRVQAHIVFGTTPIYDSIPVAALMRRSFTLASDPLMPIPIPSADANSFWQIGLQTLRMTFTVTGSAVPPDPVDASFRVIPEAPGIVSFAWANPPAASWRRTYIIRGSFANASRFSGMTITTATGMETEPSLPISLPVMLMPSVIGTIAARMGAPTSGVTGALMRIQSWEWLNAVNAISGPSGVTITYTMSFSFRDAFGNAYAGPFTSTAMMTVTISTAKRTAGAVSMAAMIVFTLWTATAIALWITAAATPYPASLVPAIAASIASTIAIAALGISIWYRAQAYDPPLPDFDYRERVHFALPESEPVNPEVANDLQIQSLNSIYHLLQRIHHANELMSSIQRKIIGAKTDEAQEFLHIHIEDYKKAYIILKRSADLLPDAIGEYEQTFRSSGRIDENEVLRILNEMRQGHIPESAKEEWNKAALPENSLDVAIDSVRQFEKLPESMFEPMRTFALALHQHFESTESDYQELIQLSRSKEN